MKITITPWQEGMEAEAGKIYSGMPNEVYHGFHEWNGSSMLKHVLRSVESYLYERKQPNKTTLALEKGRAFHCGMEGMTTKQGMAFYQEHVLPCTTNAILTKNWHQVKEDNPECYVLPESERDMIAEMVLKVYACGTALNLFDEGFAELSFFWIDDETGIKCKVRPDWIDFRPDYMRILDYKTTKNHLREGFGREMLFYNYHVSAAFYLEGVRQVSGIPFEDFQIIACNNTPPHEVKFYPVGQDTLTEGRALFQEALYKLPNYDPEEEIFIEPPLDIPKYGFNYLDTFDIFDIFE